MELKYFVPFKAVAGQSAQFSLQEKLLNIEGTAIDTSVNTNKWQVPAEDLDFFVSTLIGTQLRIDHAESAMAVIGRVPEGKRMGDSVWFRAEVGELPIIEKITRGYLDHVSVQVDSDDVQCSKCFRQTRKEGMLVHLCPGAWEIVHKPKVRELSIVASPAYEKTEFKPAGFAAAMNESQGVEFPCVNCGKQCSGDARAADQNRVLNIDGKVCVGCTTPQACLTCRKMEPDFSKLLNGNKDVGSKGDLQEPETQKNETKEVKTLPEINAQARPSPQQAQGVVNVAPGESAPKPVSYADLMNQLQNLTQQINACKGDAGADAEDAQDVDVARQIADLEGKIAKRAKRATDAKKLSDLQKQMQSDSSIGAGEDASEDAGEDAEDAEDVAKQAKKAKQRPQGAGIVAIEELPQKDSVFGNTDWFKDIAKATSKMRGFKA